MEVITVVGVGPGNRDYLIPAALKAVEEAEFLVGGQRLLDMFWQPEGREYFAISNNLQEVVDYICAKREKHRVVVLTSGDPGFYGILAHLRRHFKPSDLRVFPGISSVQIACARLSITWHDAEIISCHGRNCEQLVTAVRTHPKVIVLTGPGSAPETLAQRLVAAGLGSRRANVCCQLSYDTETVTSLTIAELAARRETKETNCVMVINHD